MALRSGNQLDLPHLVEGLLVTQFARRVDRTDDRAQILIGPEIVRVDDGGILPIRTGESDLAATRRLDQCRRDRERVRRRCAETRGGFGRHGAKLLEHQADVAVGLDDAPEDRYASASTALLSTGRSGILPLYLKTTPDTRMWSWRFLPTPGRFSTTSIPSGRSAEESPTPESISSFGLPMAPAARMTSLSARDILHRAVA